MVEVARLDIVVRSSQALRGLKATQAELVKTGAAAQAAATRMNTSFRGTTAAVSNLRGTLATLGGAFAIVGIVATLAKFEKAMDAVAAVTRGSTREIVALTDKAREMGATTVFSATQAADGMRFLAQAGFEVDKILAAIGPSLKLAQVGMLSLAESADIVSNVMAGFNIEAGEVARVADVMASIVTRANTNVRQLGEALKFAAPAAEATGQTIELTAAAIGILSDAGLQASLAGTGLRQALLKMSNVGKKAGDTLSDMGLTIEDINPEANTLTEILIKLRDANLGVAEASKLFEARAGTAVIVLTKNIDRLQKLEEAAKNSGGELVTAAAIMSDNLVGAGKAFVSVLQELILQTGDAGLTGALRDTIDFLTGTLRALTGLLDPTDELNAKFFIAADVLRVFGVVLAGLAIGKVASALLGLVGLLPRLIIGIKGATVAMTAFNFSLSGNRIGLIIAAITAAGTAYFLFRDEVEEAATTQDILTASTNTLKDIQTEAVKASADRLKALAKETEELKKATTETLQLAIAKEKDALATLKVQRASAAATIAKGPSDAQLAARGGLPLGRANVEKSQAIFAASDKGLDAIKAQEKAILDLENQLDSFNAVVEITRQLVEGEIEIPLDPDDKVPGKIKDLTAAKDIISDLRFEIEQMSRSELDQDIFESLRNADVALDTDLGQRIASLTTTLDLMTTAADMAAEAQKELVKAQEDATAEIEKYIPNQELINTKLDVYGQALEAGTIDLQLFTEITKEMEEAQNRLNPLWVEAQRVISDLKGPQEQYNEAAARYNLLLDRQLISQPQMTQALFEMRKELGLLGPEFDRQTELADGFASAITDSVGALLKGGKDIRSIFSDLAGTISDLILQITLLEPLEDFLRNSFGGTGSEREQTGRSGGGIFEAFTAAEASSTPAALDEGGTAANLRGQVEEGAAAGIATGFSLGGDTFLEGLDLSFEDVLGGFGGLFGDLLGGIGGLFSGGGGGGGIAGFIGSLFGGAMANGGTLGAGQFGIVGDSGPEFIAAGSRPLSVTPIEPGSTGTGGNIEGLLQDLLQVTRDKELTVINNNEQDPSATIEVLRTRAGVKENRNRVSADRRQTKRILGLP